MVIDRWWKIDGDKRTILNTSTIDLLTLLRTLDSVHGTFPSVLQRDLFRTMMCRVHAKTILCLIHRLTQQELIITIVRRSVLLNTFWGLLISKCFDKLGQLTSSHLLKLTFRNHSGRTLFLLHTTGDTFIHRSGTHHTLTILDLLIFLVFDSLNDTSGKIGLSSYILTLLTSRTSHCGEYVLRFVLSNRHRGYGHVSCERAVHILNTSICSFRDVEWYLCFGCVGVLGVLEFWCSSLRCRDWRHRPTRTGLVCSSCVSSSTISPLPWNPYPNVCPQTYNSPERVSAKVWRHPHDIVLMGPSGSTICTASSPDIRSILSPHPSWPKELSPHM